MISSRILISLSLVTVVSASQAFDLAQQFSATNGNPNGVWSYGYKDGGNVGGALILFDQVATTPTSPWWGHDFGAGTPAIWRNLTGSTSYGVPNGATSLHPGPSNQIATARFTAPSGGACHIEGAFGNGDFGNVDVYVSHNGTLLLAVTNIPGDQAFSFDRLLATGDTIDFMVGYAGGHAYDNTPIAATIEMVPEPAAMLALAGGMVALARRRRR